MSDVFNLGFTGTRHGMSDLQWNRVAAMVGGLYGWRGPFVAHHGDCVGADSEFHWICRWSASDATIEIHPGPSGDVARQAGCDGDVRHEGKPHMARNADIVTASHAMIAAPREATGGTVGTINIARRVGKPLAIVWPDGTVTRERWRL